METQTGEEIIYGINVNDLQDVSAQILERLLTNAEVDLVKVV